MCKRSRVLVTGTNYERGFAVYLDVPCRSYACEQCAANIVRLHQARIIHGVKESSVYANCRWTFITITSHENVRTPADSFSLLSRSWPALRKRLRRRYGHFGYVLTFEQHANGAYHMHGLVSVAMSKKWLRRHCRALGLGYMADAQKLHSPAGAGKYVAKYLSKALTCADMPKRFRRVRYSQCWPELPPIRPDSPIKAWLPLTSDVPLHVQADIEKGLAVLVTPVVAQQWLSAQLAQVVQIMG